MRQWTTDGDVRGSCGHRHRSLETARACLQADRRACKARGGYSDREVVPADGDDMGQEEDLDTLRAIWADDL